MPIQTTFQNGPPSKRSEFKSKMKMKNTILFSLMSNRLLCCHFHTWTEISVHLISILFSWALTYKFHRYFRNVNRMAEESQSIINGKGQRREFELPSNISYVIFRCVWVVKSFRCRSNLAYGRQRTLMHCVIVLVVSLLFLFAINWTKR